MYVPIFRFPRYNLFVNDHCLHAIRGTLACPVNHLHRAVDGNICCQPVEFALPVIVQKGLPCSRL